MHAKQTLLALALLAIPAIFPAAASACRSEPRAMLAFWEAPPKANAGEVVVKLRLLRIEKPEPVEIVFTSCGGNTALFVFEVLEVAEGDFAPREVTLYGSGTAHNPEATGWLVGKPATLYMKHILWVREGDPPAPEHASIEWRPPECDGTFNCRPPSPGLFKP